MISRVKNYISGGGGGRGGVDRERERERGSFFFLLTNIKHCNKILSFEILKFKKMTVAKLLFQVFSSLLFRSNNLFLRIFCLDDLSSE